MAKRKMFPNGYPDQRLELVFSPGWMGIGAFASKQQEQDVFFEAAKTSIIEAFEEWKRGRIDNAGFQHVLENTTYYRTWFFVRPRWKKAPPRPRQTRLEVSP